MSNQDHRSKNICFPITYISRLDILFAIYTSLTLKVSYNTWKTNYIIPISIPHILWLTWNETHRVKFY